MKIKVKTNRSRKLKAAARRAAHPEEDFFYDEEPNMKLSRAFIIVLILHVVAVGGIFAFNTIKTNEMERVGTGPGPVASSSGLKDLTQTSGSPRAPTETTASDRVHLVQAGESLLSISSRYGVREEDLRVENSLPENGLLQPGQRLRLPVGATAATTTPGTTPAPTAAQQATPRTAPDPAAQMARETRTTDAPASGGSTKVYQVQPGDNPYSIAQKHGVNYADLLEANNIEDPRRLQIGQELVIPAR